MKKFKAQAHLKRRSGFTLVEIMVVVVIIGLLTAVVGPMALARLEEARRTTAKTQIESFASSLELYRMRIGRYPSTAQGLDALLKKPTVSPVPRNYPVEPFIASIPVDPWQNPYIYRCPGERGAYDIVSMARDSEEGGEGLDADINNHDQL